MTAAQAYLTDLQGRVVATITPSALVTFGQDASNSIVLEDFSVSPQHGAIAFRGGAFVVERWSKGRIWINSQNHPVEGSRVLQDEDRVLIGNRHVFVFRLGAAEVGETAEAVAPPSAPPTVAAPPPPPPEAPQTMVEEAAAEVSDALEQAGPSPGEIAAEASEAAEEPAPPTSEVAPAEAVDAGAEAEEPAALETTLAPEEPAGEAIAAADAAETGEESAISEPPPARLDTGFTPAWARAEGDALAPQAEAGPVAGEGQPQGTQETVADEAIVEAPPPGPPVPIPDWASKTPAAPETTPPEGLGVPPAGWQQELQERPLPPARTTMDDEVWGVRQRSEARRLIQEAIHLLRQGYVDRARPKLNQALRLNESNEDAWLWLAAAESDPDRRRGALQRVLTINPNNVAADWGLLSMQVDLSAGWQAQQPTPPGGVEPVTPPGGYTTPPPATYTPSMGESIPALLRQDEPARGRGRAWLARLLSLVALVMMIAALFLEYGVWRISEVALWGDVPALGQIWIGFHIWGFVGIGVIAFTALLLLLIRASGGAAVGVLLTITGLAVIFMAALPVLFGLITNPQIGVVVWGAAGLPLMLGGLLKIW